MPKMNDKMMKRMKSSEEEMLKKLMMMGKGKKKPEVEVELELEVEEMPEKDGKPPMKAMDKKMMEDDEMSDADFEKQMKDPKMRKKMKRMMKK